MLSDAAIQSLICTLAGGDGDGAAHYLRHFPRKDREPRLVREALARHVLPEVMAVFDRVAPWLAEEGDDTPARIRESLAEAGVDGLSLTEVSQKVRRVPVEELREHLDRMVTARDVVIERRKTKGRPAEVFRLYEFGAGVQPANLAQDPWAWRPGPFVP